MERSDESAHDERDWTHPSEFGTFDGARREPPAALGRGLLAASAVVGALIGLTTVWLVVPTEIGSTGAPVRAATVTIASSPPPSTGPVNTPADAASAVDDHDDPGSGEPAAAGGVDDSLAPPAETAAPFATEVSVAADDPAATPSPSTPPGDSGPGGDPPGTAAPDPDAAGPSTALPDDGLAWVGMDIGTDDGAVEVLTVHADSPAHRAGLAAGQRIVAVDGRPVTSVAALVGYLVTCRPGDVVAFEVHHDSGVAVVTVELGAIEPSV